MDIHKPKPVHSWRELLSEIGVIVIGVAIALIGEQSVEALHWRHRVEDAQASLRSELSIDMAYAAEQQAMKACTSRYLDLLQGAIVADRPAAVARLYGFGTPFILRPWTVSGWEAAVSGQIPDHLDRERLALYALAYRSVATERELQFQMSDHYAEATTGRFGLAGSAEVTNQRLAALGKMRASQGVIIAVSGNLAGDYSHRLGIKPDAALTANLAGKAAACEAALQAMPAA